MNHRRFLLSTLVLALLLIALIASGCNGGTNATATLEPTSAPTSAPTAAPPTETPVTSPVETPVLSPIETPSVPSGGAVTYGPVTIPDIGLSLEAPADWTDLTPAWIWVPGNDDTQRVGVAWMALQPPQEPEAALLPENSQILNSTTVDLAFGTARRFDIEVYGEATEGGDTKAPVLSVQTHVLITVEQNTERVAIDFYAAAPTQDSLATLEPVLQHMLDTAALQQVGRGGEQDPAAAIRASVATELGVPADQVQITGVTPTDWPDACLGLPAEGEICAQVITPGYSALARANGQTYQVHANQTASHVIVIPEAVFAAQDILAKHLDISTDSIQLVSFEAVDWPDACLGIREADQVCAQVITPGYQIVFEANGQRYEVHTDATGGSVGIVPSN